MLPYAKRRIRGVPSAEGILRYLWQHDGVHRRDIIKFYGCRPNRVTDLVSTLIREGWIVEGPSQRAGTGRAPVPLHIDRESKAALAVSYAHGMRMLLVNAAGEAILTRDCGDTPDDPRVLARKLGAEAGKLVSGFSGDIVGVGIADPGMIDTIRGEVLKSTTFPQWRNVPMARMIHETTGWPVLLEDGCRLSAMAQYRALPELAASGASMLSVDFDLNLGFSLVTPDGVFRGAGFAGDVAHVVLDANGPRCRCGGRGCVETMVGGRALVAEAKERLRGGVSSVLSSPKRLTPEEILGAAARGDSVAQESLGAILPRLGLVVGMLVAAYHPRVVVIGAGTNEAAAYMAKRLKTALPAAVQPEIGRTVEVRAGGESGALVLAGAGLMVFNDVVMNNGARLFRA